MFKLSNTTRFRLTPQFLMTFVKNKLKDGGAAYVADEGTEGVVIGIKENFSNILLWRLDSQKTRINNVVGLRQNTEEGTLLKFSTCQSYKEPEGKGFKIQVKNRNEIVKIIPKDINNLELIHETNGFFKHKFITEVVSSTPENVEEVLLAHNHIIN